MSETEEVSRGKRFPLLPLLIVVALLGIALFGEKGIFRVIKSRQHRAQLQAEIAAQQAANQELRQEIDALQSDHRHLERIARKELGMVKANELVYQFRSTAEKNTPQPEPHKGLP